MRRKNYHPAIFNLFDDWNLDFARDLNFPNASRFTTPAVNIKEDKENFFVEVAAPGMNKNDFKIVNENGALTISCERKEEKQEIKEDESYSRKEFYYASFSRSFTLPESADADKITANYKEGILSVSIPKKEEAKLKPAKEIQIA